MEKRARDGSKSLVKKVMEVLGFEFYVLSFYFCVVRPKDFTALGGKVSGAGPGIEAEEIEAGKVGDDGTKLLTLGTGEMDKDAVLQAGKAEIDRLKAASQEIVFERLDIGGS